MLIRAALTITLCLLSTFASAEAPLRSRAPTLSSEITPFSHAGAYHLDLIDYSLYGAVITYRALDFFSTEPCVHSHYCEEKELPQFVVNTKPGFIAFEASATATEIISSYLLHRRGHGRMARTIDVFSIGSGAWAVDHNYTLKTR
jgi:hypothetical protein